MIEEWRNVEGFEGQYQVSSLGRVKSVQRKRKIHFGLRERTVRERILKTEVKGDGYVRVVLSTPTKPNRVYVHRLAAQAFIPNPDNKPEIDHINRNRSDNRVINLRWVTHKENLENVKSK